MVSQNHAGILAAADFTGFRVASGNAAHVGIADDRTGKAAVFHKSVVHTYNAAYLFCRSVRSYPSFHGQSLHDTAVLHIAEQTLVGACGCDFQVADMVSRTVKITAEDRNAELLRTGQADVVRKNDQLVHGPFVHTAVCRKFTQLLFRADFYLGIYFIRLLCTVAAAPVLLVSGNLCRQCRKCGL